MDSTDVFEEWTAYAKKKALLPREIDLNSAISNSDSKIVAITGIRRSGKSSVLMLLAQKLLEDGKKAAYVNVEDSRIKDDKDLLDSILKWFGEEGYLLLDEVTNAHDWQGWLARTHELLKGKLRLIVSSSRKSLVLPNKPLRGRILPFELFPLSFREFLAFRGVGLEKTTAGRGRLERAFAEYLKYGGFPEVVLAKEGADKVSILNSYFKDIVGLDVAEISGEDISTVEAFGKYVIQSPYFSASKCLNFFKSLGYKIGKEKILQLEKYAEAGYLFAFIPVFSYSIKDKSIYPRKAYSGDVGFYYSTTGRIDFGRLYENLAFLELKRRAGGQKEVCYWRGKDGAEVDFVVRQGTNVNEAVQVTYATSDKNTRERELRGIAECANELRPVKSLVLTKDLLEIKNIGGVRVRFIPLMDWLMG